MDQSLNHADAALLTDAHYGEALAFWRERLALLEEGDVRYAATAAPAAGGLRQSRETALTSAARAALAQLAGDGAGRFAVLAAALALLLGRYCGRRTAVLQAPVPEGGAVLPLIVALPRRGSRRAWLGAMVEVVEASWSRPDFPLAALLRREGRAGSALGNVELREVELHGEGAGQNEIEVALDWAAGVVRATWDEGCVEGFVVADWLRRLNEVLASLGALDEPVAQVEVGDEQTRRQLAEWNATAVPRPAATVLDLFAAQVARAPRAPALIFGEETLTYAEVDRSSRQLARYLQQEHGVGPEVLVGIRMERCPWLVLAVLGVFRAGGAFVPLDPELPRQRLDYIVADTGMEVVLGLEGNRVGELDAAQVALDGLDLGAAESISPPPEPADLAYVLYTSGSTGWPKGCQVEHRALYNYISWANAFYFDGDEGGHFGLYSPLSFDFTLTSLFCPLTRGKSLYVYPPELDAARVLQHCFGDEGPVDSVKLTPAHIALLQGMRVERTRVRRVIVGGEALTAAQVALLHGLSPGLSVYNEYGPTEATVGCIVEEVERGARAVAIGRPIANMRAYIVGEDQCLLPAGARGEICLAGEGLARGYWRRPGLTAEKFVADPLRPGERFYRTGDIGRWLPDGRMECFGRMDDQIKIRGHRVELGEVERVLGDHPQVAVAAAALWKEQDVSQLAAYVVAEGALEADGLRRFLRARLPEYMVPSALVALEALPMTSNGKVDRRALPAPAASRSLDAAADGGPPRTDEERALARIWGALFHLKEVGREADFFELGGDSLLAAQVVSRLWEELGVELDIGAVFDRPCLAELAAQAGASGGDHIPAIAPVPRGGPLPLSFAQQRLWLLDRVAGAGAAYNVATALRLVGGLDPASLGRAAAALVQRHEVLRSCVVECDGQAQLEVLAAASVEVPIKVSDLRGCPPEERDERVRRRAAAVAGAPFDLGRAPLLRLELIHLDEGEHVLVLALHHLICDAWSLEICVRQFSELYAAAVEGREAALTPPAIQYADYAVWQRQWLASGAEAEQLAYWKKQLAGAPALTQLPLDRPRRTATSWRGRTHRFRLGTAVADGVRRLGRTWGASSFMVLLSAFAALLRRYGAQEDIVLGAPIANRHRAGTQDLVGCLVNTLALRVDTSGRPSFAELVGRVRRMTLAAFAHQDLPFERLVDALHLERDLKYTPLFQVLFDLQNAPEDELALPGVRLEDYELENETAKFDLTLSLSAREGGLAGEFEYNAELFAAETLERLAVSLQMLLEAAVGDPDMPIAALPVLSAADQRQLVGWSGTVVGAALPPLHESISQWAGRDPQRIAVIGESEQLSYGELEERADELARRLAARGVGTGQRVGVCLQRAPAMVAVVLGVLKVGAAYVPLDAGLPRQRLEYIIEDAGLEWVVSQRDLAAGLADVQVLLIDPDGAEGPAANRLPTSVAEESPAYLIYTSGSTGQPKGAVVSHGALARFAAAAADCYDLAEGDRLLQFAALSFDASVEEIFCTLYRGAALVLRSRQSLDSVEYFLDEVARQQITLLDLPTAFWRQLSSELERGTGRLPECVRAVIVGGEAMPSEAVRAWHRAVDGRVRLFNTYGPTEATVDATVAELAGAESLADGEVPIGRSLPGKRVYVLDDELRLVPPGVVGELCIGGPQLATGYWGRPGLTAASFCPDPFAGTPGARLYRTGDLARWRADGQLLFVGRRDGQVKVRGFRIELEEIEAVLAACPAVAQAAVAALEGGAGNRTLRLVAYIVWRERPADGAETLLRFLRERLPEYMVPAHFVDLQALPKTSSDKIDRRALPAVEVEAGKTAPRTPAEHLLASVWGEVLGVEDVGAEDNFFALGGDSILALQVVARARQRGLSLTGRQLFERQTVAALAAVAGEAAGPVGEQGPISGPVPLTPIQAWFFAGRRREPAHYNQSLLLEVPAAVSAADLERAAAALWRHHDALRARFVRRAGQWEQEWAPPEAPVELLEVEELPGAEVEELAARCDEVQRGFDLAGGPLWRARLFDLGPKNSKRLLLIAHHLVVDGVTWRLLVEDLLSACRQALEGAAIELPPKTSSYKAWSAHLRRRSDQVADAQLAYWLNALGRAPQGGTVAGEAYSLAAATSVSVRLDETATRRLLRGPRPGQIDAVLLAALVLAWRSETGQAQLLVDVEGHGRQVEGDELDLSRTAGWFTAVYPVLLEAVSGEAPESTLTAVRRRLEEVPDGGIGYGILRYLHPAAAERLAELPVAQVLFNYLGQTDGALEQAEGWKWVEADTGEERSRRDGRDHLLEINAAVRQGCLEVDWIYSESVHQRAVVEQLAVSHLRCAEALIGSGRRPDTPAEGEAEIAGDLLADGSIEEVYALAPLQEGLLFHALYEPESPAYFEQFSCTLRGPLRIEALVSAWERVAARHPILRTGFRWRDLERPLQVVRASVELPWQYEDWREIPPRARERRWTAWLAEDRGAGFALERPPLWRCALIRLGEDEYRFCWSHHHILLDGWSAANLLAEVFALYAVAVDGGDALLPEVPPYKAYIDWLAGRNSAPAEEFWRQYLADLSAPTPLPVDRLAEAEQGSGYAARERSLSSALSRQLEERCRAERLTVNALLRGAWALLLSRYGGTRDVLYGATVAGRPAELEGVEHMVGLFINTLPVRCRVEPQWHLADWLRRIQAEQAAMEDFAYSALPDIQRWSGAPAGQALFESLLVFENYPTAELADEGSGGLGIDRFEVFEQTTYPLALVAAPGEQLYVRLRFDGSRYKADFAECLLDQLEEILRVFAAEPHKRLAEIPAMDEEERHKVLEAFNATQRPTPPLRCAHELFEERAHQNPRAVALWWEGGALSYAALDARANRLAHHLRRLGAAPEVRVGVCLERSAEQVVALLAVLKAGAAYVPLDPEHPRARLALVLEDAAPQLLVTRAALLADLPADQTRAVCLDRDAAAIAAEEEAHCGGGATPENLVYAMYTSGSTGTPKGVLIDHAALCQRLYWVQDKYGLTAEDRVVLKTSFGFDVSVREIFWPLMVGARLIVAGPEGHRDSRYLARLLERQQVSVLNAVPTLLDLLLDEPALGRCRRLRRVLAGGEGLTPGLRDRLLDTCGAALHNHCGPTEATITATSWDCLPEDRRELVPIGFPVANTCAYLLDEAMLPVPVGAPGELYIGGAGLARGYLGRPGMTAERFCPDPFSGVLGARLYRTGDRGRWLADGSIEFLGRVDAQIKVRGLRVEAGEIEAHLEQHPGVRQAAVRLWRDGAERLVAYCAVEPGAACGAGELRAFLGRRLPAYWIPEVFTCLEALPLTPGGKVDRQALPPPADDGRSAAAYLAPRDGAERRLVRIWEDVLERRPVGVRDDFFALGGHSVLAVRLASRIEQEFQRPLPLAQLFGRPTVEALAAALREGGAQEAWDPLVAIRTEGERPPVFLLPGAGGNVLYFYELAHRLDARQPVYALQAIGLDGRTPPLTSVEAIAAAHLEAVGRAQEAGPYFLAAHSFGGQVALEMARQWRAAGEEMGLLAILDTPAPVFARQPLGRTWDEADWLAKVVSEIELFFGVDLRLNAAQLRPLVPEEQLEKVAQGLRHCGLWAPDADVAQLRGFLQVYQVQTRIEYRPPTGTALGPVALFKAADEGEGGEENEDLARLLRERAWGWEGFAAGEVEVAEVPGEHLTMLGEPHVGALAAALDACLARHQAETNALPFKDGYDSERH